VIWLRLGFIATDSGAHDLPSHATYNFLVVQLEWTLDVADDLNRLIGYTYVDHYFAMWLEVRFIVSP
jgi:hypothetical protein